MTQSIQFAIEKGQPWETIGKAWNSRDGKSINATIGNARKVKKEDGTVELVESIKEVVLTPGSKLFITPSGFKAKEGQTNLPPQYLIKLVPAKDQE